MYQYGLNFGENRGGGDLYTNPAGTSCLGILTTGMLTWAPPQAVWVRRIAQQLLPNSWSKSFSLFYFLLFVSIYSPLSYYVFYICIHAF